MFKIGDIVKYGVNGICKITDITVRSFLGENVEYYELTSTSREDSFYVPTKNEKLVAKIQYILSKDEVYDLIGSIPECAFEWDAEDKVRAEKYESIFSSGDRRNLVGLVRTLKAKKDELAAKGKKLHVADERALASAEKVIAEEFSEVLEIKKSEVGTFIESLLSGT